MFLHGEIKVNDRVIGSWSARRINPLTDDADEMHEYEVAVNMIDEGLVTSKVTHFYADGEAILAAKALATFNAPSSRNISAEIQRYWDESGV